MKTLCFSLTLLCICTFAGAQNINCKLPAVNSLDFFFNGTENEKVIWPDSTIAEINYSLQDSIDDNIALQFLPLAMLEMKSYFENGINQAAFYRVINYSKLFSAVLKDSSWNITMSDFCPATEKMINRFNAWYGNDSMMAILLYTTDRGPFFGSSFQVNEPDMIYPKDSLKFPNSSISLFLGNYNDLNIIYTKDATGNIIYASRILEKYHEEDVKSLFTEVKCIEIKDFGYSIIIFVSDGVCRLYFDEKGILRFYFIM